MLSPLRVVIESPVGQGVGGDASGVYGTWDCSDWLKGAFTAKLLRQLTL